VNRLIFSGRNVNAVQHVRSKSEAIAELFDRDRQRDEQPALGLCVREVQECDVGQMDRERHRPQAFNMMTPTVP
jgi:hypothetical protein